MATLLLGMLALSACGDGAGKERAIRKTVESYYAAFAAKDAASVCGSMSDSAKRQMDEAPGTAGKGCEQVMRLVFSSVGSRLDVLREARVADVAINGDRATATVDFRNQAGRLGLVREGERWKVDDVGGATPGG